MTVYTKDIEIGDLVVCEVNGIVDGFIYIINKTGNGITCLTNTGKQFTTHLDDRWRDFTKTTQEKVTYFLLKRNNNYDC